MPRNTRVPPISESRFRREYFTMWAVAGASCLVIGLVVAPPVVRARGPWMGSLIAIGVYLFSLLICPIVLSAVWRRPAVTPPVLYFSIPVGAAAVLAVAIMNWIGPQFSAGRRSMICFAIAVGLMYVASLIWAIGLGIRRKNMGEFRIDERL